jgi:hypothetical protein
VGARKRLLEILGEELAKALMEEADAMLDARPKTPRLGAMR